MNDQVELVAQAIYEAEHGVCLWEGEPARHKERFREYARNAIELLDEDIGVLLLALQEANAGARLRRSKGSVRRDPN
ncbi:hypothetical protein AA309_01845 [Microvirga vignae]|uniref:Uncharacterized protein n=1 Tax=Microvirga vignae TaxID=1225564 RepID=A0A0H1RHK9_9HYPH|nr:hypothetical protein [Microvirga vignae]KLK94730.1 hypothetical protein AA309_01845 [Microvirga vignae]